MKCAKIIVKSNYEQRGDLILRSYIRALKKADVNFLLDGDSAFIYGIVDGTGAFCEIFTNTIIDYDEYVDVSRDEYELFCKNISCLSNARLNVIKNIIDKTLFNKKIDLGFEDSAMEELAKDRAIEFDAYDNFLSNINPYCRLNNDNNDRCNDYNNFLRKIEKIKEMKKNDSIPLPVDEFEVLENPKKLVRK